MKRVILFIFATFMLLFNINPTFAQTSLYNAPKSTQTKSIDNLTAKFPHQIKTVFSDIDGTLFPFNAATSNGEIPQSVYLGAEKLKAAKIPLILATGRSANEAIQIAKKLGYNDTYVIAQQGAEIYSTEGKILYQDTIKNEDAKRMLKEISKFNKSSKMFFYYEGKAYSLESFTPPYILDKVTPLKSVKELNKNFAPVKIAIYDENPEALRAIQAHLKKLFPNYHVDISARCYCDISSQSATKGNAIEKLSEILKIDLKTSAVLGDAENDVSMFKLIKSKGGLAIAVGNAMPSVKKNADFVTSSVDEDGFENAIDKIILNNNLQKTSNK